MENGDGSEFGKQFAGSAAANVVFMVGLLIYKFIEGRCKHSKCSSNTRFCRCSADNYETERRAGSNKDIKNAVRPQESLQKMFRRDDEVLQKVDLKTLELRAEESIEGSARERIVARGEGLV